MEGLKQRSPEKLLSRVVGFTILAGVILKLMDNQYGAIVFTIGFLGYFFLKFLKLSRIQKFFWTRLHTFQLIVLVLATVSVILLYFNYPYSRVAFVVLLLAESLINLKIMINKYIGSDNFKTILGFLGRLLRR